jgi:glucose-6-phosphate 1-dehydrogenase
MDVVRGDQTLFMRRDEVEAAWRWIDPILEAWENEGTAPNAYTAGTWGPTALGRPDRARRPHLA